MGKSNNKISAFLKRKGVEFSFKRYFVDALGAMGVGLFSSLITGLILRTIGTKAGIPILAMRDTPWLVHEDNSPFEPADCLASGGDAVSCGIKRSAVLAERNPTLDFVKQFPLLKPLDMSDAVCAKEICRAVEGNVLIYHDSHHLSATYMRTMAGELSRQIAAATGWW